MSAATTRRLGLAILETARLTVRQIDEADAQGPRAADGDPDAMRFWDFPATRDVNETAAHIRRSIRAGALRQAALAILLRAFGFVGMINDQYREPRNRRSEFGWILAPGFWRRGLMTGAAQAVPRHCFAKLKAHRVGALLGPENVASRALAAKLGFLEKSSLLRDRLCSRRGVPQRADVRAVGTGLVCFAVEGR